MPTRDMDIQAAKQVLQLANKLHEHANHCLTGAVATVVTTLKV